MDMYPLHCYVKQGDEVMTRHLPDINYDINVQDFFGITPLMIAVRNKQEKMIELLLEAGADTTILNRENKSALHMFCAEHYFTFKIRKLFFQELRKKFSTSKETAQCLIDAGCHLYQAACLSDAKVIEYMLNQGLPYDSMNPIVKQTTLHIAVSLNDIDSVKLLLKCDSNKCSGFNISKKFSFLEDGSNAENKLIFNDHFFQSVDLKESSLNCSVECDNEKLTSCLLDRNSYVNAQDYGGTTALMIAVRNRHEEMIELLLDAGSDMTILNRENKSALHMFCEDHNFISKFQKLFFQKLGKKFLTSEGLAQCLIDAGCHLYRAVHLNDTKIIEYMLEQGISADSMHPASNKTALHLAVSVDNVDSVKLLLQYGANFKIPDIEGSIPLFYVYHYNLQHTSEKIKLLQIFLNLELSPTSCNSSGFFQVAPTLKNGNYEAIRVVLQSNIDFAAKDHDNGRSILHYFAANRNPGVVEQLKPYVDKFDINVVDESGMSPLHVAIKYSNADMVQFLLSQGATPNCAQNWDGYTPLYNAFAYFKPQFENQWDQCLELLLQYNADPQFIATEENNQQITVFDAAAKTNALTKMKPVIAHLAVLEGLGVSINKTTRSKMNSYPSLIKYFNKCQKLTRKEICGSVTIFKLLTDNKKKIARYLGNKKLMLKLIRLNYKSNLKFSHSYYHNTLKKRISEGIQYRKFADEVVEVIYEIFEGRLDKKNLIISKIVDYLNDESLERIAISKNDITKIAL